MSERAYQKQAFWARFRKKKRLRRYLLAWLRQGGKTTGLARSALREMMEKAGHLVTFASASLGIGSEMIVKQTATWHDLVEKEARTWQSLIARLQTEAGGEYRLVASQALDPRGDAARELGADFKWEDLAEILTQNRFELKLWHSNTVCSRTKIIAAAIATARSWSGSVYLDEAAFVRDLAVLLAELEPMFGTDPFFSFIMATTPPEDYGHFAYELMSAADGREDEDYEVNPDGNWVQNKEGLWVHRVTIDDAYAAGRKCYDADTGAEQTPDQNREQSLNRAGWDRSNRLKRPQVGTNMISPMAINTAMAKGKNFVAVEGEISAAEVEKVISLLGPGRITIGMDLASTAGKKSNPTALALVQKSGTGFNVPLVWWWKTADPNVTETRVKDLVSALRARDFKVESMDIDATNERLFSQRLKDMLRRLDRIVVRLLIKGRKVDYRGQEMNLAALLGHQAKNVFEDSRIAIPGNKYLAGDISRKKTDGDGFTAAVGPNGEHADTMDAIENGLYGQLMRGGKVQAGGVPVGDLAKASGGKVYRAGLKNPLLRKFADVFRLNS